MPTIPKVYARLALMQAVFVIYAVLFAGTWIKIHIPFGNSGPLAYLVRDYGFLLLLLPTAWGLWAVVAAQRAGLDEDRHLTLLLIGWIVTAFLFFVACIATTSAARGGALTDLPTRTSVKRLPDAR